MNWRDTLIGAAITLGITIAAGVMVYYLTKEPSTQPAEKLAYSVENNAIFGVGANKLSFLTVKFENTGNKTAHNVRIFYEMKSALTMQDKVIAFSSAGLKMTDNSADRKLDITIPSLVPTEVATLALLIKGPDVPETIFSVKSDDSIGTKKPSPSLKENEKSIPTNIFVMVLAGALVFQALIFLGIPRLREVRLPQAPSLNNTAFVYLQENLATGAKELLETQIRAHGGNAIVLANYGLALGMTGDAAGAAQYLEMAEAWAEGDFAKALVAYNRAIFFLKSGDNANAKQQLRAALKLSKRRVSRYCKMNKILITEAERDPELKNLIQGSA